MSLWFLIRHIADVRHLDGFRSSRSGVRVVFLDTFVDSGIWFLAFERRAAEAHCNVEVTRKCCGSLLLEAGLPWLVVVDVRRR